MVDFNEANRAYWNEITPAHSQSEFYGLESFKAGRNSLLDIELNELGDVSGKSMLHLQCHFGQDTLSWARLGARVTGADISDESIDMARSLAEELGMEALFVRSDVYDLPHHLDGSFDIVFTSYGVIIWLPDLDRWAEVIDHFLKPGGTFFIAEFHPMATVFDFERDDGRLEVRYPYFKQGLPQEWVPDGEGSYAAQDVEVTSTTYEWSHGLGEVVTALAARGLVVQHLNEHRRCAYRMLPFMVRGDDGMWRLPENGESVPLMFSLKASKPALP